MLSKWLQTEYEMKTISQKVECNDQKKKKQTLGFMERISTDPFLEANNDKNLAVDWEGMYL